jgi:D-sedoheptulose 7-phosphate isomerase
MHTKYKEYVNNYLSEVIEIVEQIDRTSIVEFAESIEDLRFRGGRLFILGVGGSAANASHAVNDFRKIAGVECYSGLDNVSELTARINDEGWDTSLSEWLKVSNIRASDSILILSVGGGGDITSQNLVKAMECAKAAGASILSLVSRDGGKAKELSDVCVLIPVIQEERITPHAEEWQAILWHMIVSAIATVKR